MAYFKSVKVSFVLGAVLITLLVVRLAQYMAPLHPQLISVDNEKRNLGLSRLAQLDEKSREKLFPQLLQDLKNPDARVQRFALYALRKLGQLENPSLAAVASCLSDSNAEVREEAALVLMESGEKSIPVVLRIFREGNDAALQSAGEIVRRYGPSALPALVQTIQSSRHTAGQRQALDILRQWGPLASESGPALIQLLESGETAVKRDIALTLVAVSTETKAAFPILIAALKQSFDPEAVEALGKMGTSAKAALPFLHQRLLEGKDSLKREQSPRPLIARALAKIDPRRTTFTDIQWDLKQKNSVVRYRAAYELSQRQALDSSVTPILIPFLSDADPFVAGRIAETLVRIGIKSVGTYASTAYPALVGLLGRVSDEKHIEGFQERLAPAVASLGTPILPELVRALKKGVIDFDSAKAVVELLDASTEPFLRACLNDASSEVQKWAEAGLDRFAKDSSPE